MPDPNRVIDNTHLSIEKSIERGVVHRDMLCHVLRWTYIANVMRKGGRYKEDRVLDVGCGVDVPLACLLHSNRLIVDEYVGVDYNPKGKFTDRNFGRMPVSLYGGTIFPRDFTLNKDGTYCVKNSETRHKLPTVVAMLEVWEHVLSKHGVAMLKAFHKIATAGNSEVFLSTPCWDTIHLAANHIAETKHAALGAVIEDLGFEIMENHGTFGSIREYKDALFEKYGEGMRQFFEDQRAYHDSNTLSNMFCNPFPELSRNSIWRIRPAKEGYVRKFPMLADIKTPWASSTDWQELDTIGGQANNV